MADLLQDHTKDFMAALARVKEVNDEAVATQTEAANDRVQVDFEIEKLKTRQQALNNTLNAAAKMRTAAQQALHALAGKDTALRAEIGASVSMLAVCCCIWPAHSGYPFGVAVRHCVRANFTRCCARRNREAGDGGRKEPARGGIQ